MRQKKIFKRRRAGQDMKALAIVLGIGGLAALSFSAGVEVGRSDKTILSWVVDQAQASDSIRN